MSKPCIMIMAGGTGGHVFPALALADVLRSRDCEVVWLGTRAGIEARLVPAAGIPVEWVDIGGVRGKGLATLLAAPLRIFRALLQAIAAMRRHRPCVVVGLGGYVTGPGGLAAWLTRRPLVIHEQNAVAGLTNRVLARFATRVLEAFEGSFGARRDVYTVGNPVRRKFFELPAPALRSAATTRSPSALSLTSPAKRTSWPRLASPTATLPSAPPGWSSRLSACTINCDPGGVSRRSNSPKQVTDMKRAYRASQPPSTART